MYGVEIDRKTSNINGMMNSCGMLCYPRWCKIAVSSDIECGGIITYHDVVHVVCPCCVMYRGEFCCVVWYIRGGGFDQLINRHRT